MKREEVKRRSTHLREYVHPGLNQEVTAIGGRYVLVKEARLPFQGREVLYVVGHAAFDTSCCGAGGCGYALVPGIIVEWRTRMNEDDRPVSLVEPVDNQAVQKDIQRLIEEREMVHQVRFQQAGHPRPVDEGRNDQQ